MDFPAHAATTSTAPTSSADPRSTKRTPALLLHHHHVRIRDGEVALVRRRDPVHGVVPELLRLIERLHRVEEAGFRAVARDPARIVLVLLHVVRRAGRLPLVLEDHPLVAEDENATLFVDLE